MSSADTIFYGGEFPFYSNLDDSRLQIDDPTANQFSFSQQFPAPVQQPQPQEKNITNQSSSSNKDQSSDLSHFKTPDEEKPRTPRQRVIVSLLPDYLAKKTQSRKEEITIYFFNSDKKMSFQKEELNKYFGICENTSINTSNTSSKQQKRATIKQLIPYVVKSYCKLILSFQPLQIAEESFQLKLANFDNHDDPAIDPFSHDLDIQYLYDADNLVLVRKPRSMDKINDWVKLFGDKTDLEIIEVLMPEKKEFTIQIERNKTVNAVKEKIAGFSAQLGKITLVGYYNFGVCENKKKVVDLDQKIFEVYREKVQDYIDRPAANNGGHSFTNVNFYEQLWKNSTRNEEQLATPVQFFVNQTTLHGKQTLSLSKSSLIEHHTGGLLSSFPFTLASTLMSHSFQQAHTKTYSIHTLVGIKNTQGDELMLKFMYKDRCEVKVYRFEFKEKKEGFLKSLLKVGRVYDKKWGRIGG